MLEESMEADFEVSKVRHHYKFALLATCLVLICELSAVLAAMILCLGDDKYLSRTLSQNKYFFI